MAREAAVTEVVVTNSPTEVLLYGKVVHGFTPEMEAALQNGIPVTFTFFVELHKIRSSWLDRQIASLSFDHAVSYDNLKEEYRVELQEKGEKTVATHSLQEAKTLMTDINGLRIASLHDLKPGGEYLLKVKAKLARKTLPLNVHDLIPFWGLWDFETEWHTTEFSY